MRLKSICTSTGAAGCLLRKTKLGDADQAACHVETLLISRYVYQDD